MSTALVCAYDNVPDPMKFVREMGDDIAKSGMFGCQTVEQGRVLALTCLVKRQDPMSLLETYHLIQGDLSMRADAMLAGLSRVGGKYRMIRRTPDVAEIEISRGDEVQRFSLSWEEAQQEPFTKNKKGEVKDNYATPRSRMQMLWARVVSDGVRVMWPEIVCGAYTPEEISDYSNQPVKITAEPATDDSAVDASFTVVQEAAAASTTQPPAGDPAYATHEQVEQIRNLFQALGVDADAQNAILAKKKITSLRSLTREQAAEMLGKLQAKVNPTAAAQTESVTSIDTNGPATFDQVTAIKKLAAEVEQLAPGTVQKLSEKLKACGLSKLADLSFNEARTLETALQVKNLEAFFTASLQGFKPGN